MCSADACNIVFVIFCVPVITDVAVIQSLGEQIKVRQQVIATATIYFKRFYARCVHCKLFVTPEPIV